jgi:Zn-dependent peptidase ImmA (M78 family)
MIYNQLLIECSNNNVDVYEMNLMNKGLYSDGIIAINSRLRTVEKTCILAEELGHYKTSYGNILDQTKTVNIKQENRARNWAYEKLVTFEGLVNGYKHGCSNRYELSEYLHVTEQFLEEAIKHYKQKYGLCYTLNEYTIYFDPLGILKIFGSR